MNTPIDPTSPGVDSPEWAQACATLYDIFCPERAGNAQEGEGQAEQEGEAA